MIDFKRVNVWWVHVAIKLSCVTTYISYPPFLIFRYPNGEDYVGHFKDGFRHGHGTLKSSQNKSTLDTVYVGNWENDIKTGYGVIDYIVR